MKKCIVTIFLCFFALNVMAQIEMFDVSAQRIDEVKTPSYDSLRNITTQRNGGGDNYEYTLHHLIGQTLMYCGDPFDHFSKHSFGEGTYYRVDGILPNVLGEYHRLQLTNIETGEKTEESTNYTSNYNTIDYNYEWVVVGHYEKMKSLYLNKQFVYVGTEDVIIAYPGKKANNLINLETDNVTTNIPIGSIWTCIGVQVKPRKDYSMYDDKRSPIVLIVDNPQYGKHYCYLEDETGKPYKSFLDDKKPLVCGRFQLKSDYDKMQEFKAKRKTELTKKYGASNANLIVEGKVRIGMTKAMCEEAWGTPDKINKTIGPWGTHEQWVYGSSYLYFEENKLTTIQN